MCVGVYVCVSSSTTDAQPCVGCLINVCLCVCESLFLYLCVCVSVCVRDPQRVLFSSFVVTNKQPVEKGWCVALRLTLDISFGPDRWAQWQCAVSHLKKWPGSRHALSLKNSSGTQCCLDVKVLRHRSWVEEAWCCYFMSVFLCSWWTVCETECLTGTDVIGGVFFNVNSNPVLSIM